MVRVMGGQAYRSARLPKVLAYRLERLRKVQACWYRQVLLMELFRWVKLSVRLQPGSVESRVSKSPGRHRETCCCPCSSRFATA